MLPWIDLIGSAGVIVAMIGTIVALTRNGRKDTQEDTAGKAETQVKLNHIAQGVDDIKLEQRAMRGEVSELATRVTRVEESAKQAHKRLDRHEENMGEKL